MSNFNFYSNYFRKSLVLNSLKNFNLLYYLYYFYINFFSSNCKSDINLNSLLNKFFPIVISDFNVILYFIDYRIVYPKKNYYYCISNGLTYSFDLVFKFSLIFYNNNIGDVNDINRVITEEVTWSNIPMITPNSTFIIGGIEKVIVSKFNIASGIYLIFNKKPNKFLYVVRVIPDKGARVDFYISKKNFLILCIKQKKLSLITLLKSLGLNNKDIVKEFFNFEYIYFFNNLIKLKFIEKFFLNFSIPYDIKNENGDILVFKNEVLSPEKILIIKKNKIKYILIDKNYLLNRFLASKVILKKKKIINFGVKITNKIIKKFLKYKVKKIKILYVLNKSHFSIIKTLKKNSFTTLFNLNIVNNFFFDLGFNIFSSNIMSFQKNIYYKYFFEIFKPCRDKINYLFKDNSKINLSLLNFKDVINIIKLLISFKEGYLVANDMQNLNNLNFQFVSNVIEEYLYSYLFNLKNIIYIKLLNFKEYYLNLSINEFFDFIKIEFFIKKFFNSSKYSQFLDQVNSLSELSHKRRVTFLGILGISKKHSGFNVRDLNASYYSRLCPIETPEGINIGLVSSLSLFTVIDKNFFLRAPYYKVINGKIKNKICYLDAAEEKNYIIADPSTEYYPNKYLKKNYLLARYNENLINVKSNLINYIDIKSYQMLSISASLIPFLEYNDSNRALMASNMLRQALPCLVPERPLIGTGVEGLAGFNTNSVIFCNNNGIVDYVDSQLIIIKNLISYNKFFFFDFDIYFLSKFKSSNQHTNISQRSRVDLNNFVNKGDVLADGSCTDLGEISLGQNVLVAFMSWGGYNFEDSIIVSEKLIIDDRYTSLDLIQIDISVFITKYGPEYTTKNIYDYNKVNFKNLNEFGIISIGSKVKGGDVLVGKVTPVLNINDNLSTEEIVIHDVYKEKLLNNIDNSFYLPNNFSEGVVSNVEIIFSSDCQFSDLDKNIFNKQVEFYSHKTREKFLNIFKKIKKNMKEFLIGKEILNNVFNIKENTFITKQDLKYIKIDDLLNIILKDNFLNSLFENFKNKLKFILKNYRIIINDIKKKKFFRKLPYDICKIIKVYIIIKKRLQIGDKMSGRHGNKGVISKILPVNEMPYASNGIPVDIILNPLGVPSRMNIGQLLEIDLGFLSMLLSWKINNILNKKFVDFFKLRNIMFYIYNDSKYKDINLISDKDIFNLSVSLKKGIYFSIPAFSNYKIENVDMLWDLAFSDGEDFNVEFSESKKQLILYDGLTGKKFDNPITVGFMYLLKLNHLVEDKIHARSIGPYSLITQQPLKGRSNYGGQRLGEMEVWALEAYGASHTLQEMLTIKSDDKIGRFELYKNIINGKFDFKCRKPETFNVMLKNVNSLSMYMRLTKN